MKRVMFFLTLEILMWVVLTVGLRVAMRLDEVESLLVLTAAALVTGLACKGQHHDYCPSTRSPRQYCHWYIWKVMGNLAIAVMAATAVFTFCFFDLKLGLMATTTIIILVSVLHIKWQGKDYRYAVVAADNYKRYRTQFERQIVG